MEILQHFARIIENVKAPIVLELGMCDGYHSNLMLSIIKSKDRLFMFNGFEPNADLHPNILNNIKGHLMFNHGIIAIVQHAVGAEVGEMTFYKSGGVKMEKGKIVDRYYGSSSIRKPKLIKGVYPSMTFQETKVFVTTLDHHVKNIMPGYDSSGMDKIDFIWSDIQGAEVDMIKGGKETFKKVRYLYTEYINGEHYEGQGIGVQSILDLLPDFEVVEDYGGDVLLKNKLL